MSESREGSRRTKTKEGMGAPRVRDSRESSATLSPGSLKVNQVELSSSGTSQKDVGKTPNVSKRTVRWSLRISEVQQFSRSGPPILIPRALSYSPLPLPPQSVLKSAPRRSSSTPNLADLARLTISVPHPVLNTDSVGSVEITEGKKLGKQLAKLFSSLRLRKSLSLESEMSFQSDTVETGASSLSSPSGSPRAAISQKEQDRAQHLSSAESTELSTFKSLPSGSGPTASCIPFSNPLNIVDPHPSSKMNREGSCSAEHSMSNPLFASISAAPSCSASVCDDKPEQVHNLRKRPSQDTTEHEVGLSNISSCKKPKPYGEMVQELLPQKTPPSKCLDLSSSERKSKSYTRSPRRETEGEAQLMDEESHKLKFGSTGRRYNVSESKKQDTKVAYSKEPDIMEISASSEEPGSVVVKEDEPQNIPEGLESLSECAIHSSPSDLSSEDSYSCSQRCFLFVGNACKFCSSCMNCFRVFRRFLGRLRTFGMSRRQRSPLQGPPHERSRGRRSPGRYRSTRSPRHSDSRRFGRGRRPAITHQESAESLLETLRKSNLI